MLNGTNLIKGRWKIIKAIGAGAFGEIYAGKSIITSELVAIKVEKADSKKQVLKAEVAALKKLQACPSVCRFITCGRYNDYNYLVMELLGDNLSELRRKTPSGKFSMSTTLQLGVVFVRSLEQIHDLGYLHRDVKPSNFVIGNEGRQNQVFLIDFGLARKFVMPDGSIRPARDQAGFRGTARYASINSHMSRDLGRRDDLWSVFYILIEFAKGFLPWRKLKEKDEIRDVKIQMNTPELVDELPKEFLQFMDHLQALDYADRPDYDYLVQLLQHRLKLLGCENTPYDWETSAGMMSNGIANTQAPLTDLRPDSVGRPVMSTDVPAPDDPDNPVVYKLVAGGRRGTAANQQQANDENQEGDDRQPLGNFTDSAEEGRGGANDDDNSDLGAPDDDEDDSAAGSDRGGTKRATAGSTAPTSGPSPSGNQKPTPNHSNKQSPRNSDQEHELDDVSKPKANHRGNRQNPPPHSSEKCKCTIL